MDTDYKFINLNKKKEEIYKLIDEINENTDYLCAKQFYNYWYGVKRNFRE